MGETSNPLKTTTHSFYFLQTPLLIMQIVQDPLFRQSPLYIVFFVNSHLKVRFFSELL